MRLGDLIKAKEEALAPLSRTNTARERSTNEGRDDTQREREREREENEAYLHAARKRHGDRLIKRDDRHSA